MVNALLANGHSQAERYPICRLLVESRLLQQHLNAQHATQGLLVQAAVASVLSKEGRKGFSQLIEGLTNG